MYTGIRETGRRRYHHRSGLRQLGPVNKVDRFPPFLRFGNARALSPIEQEANMDSDYVFLCGVMWCGYGQEDAGSELKRAAECDDPDLSSLALAMLQEGYRSVPQLRAVN
jgi:hypothetical protein